MRTILRIICGIVTALLLLAATAWLLDWNFNRPPVDIAKLKALKQGATREQVEATLGKPASTYDNDRKWAYSKPLGWSIVYIYFDHQGRFDKYEYDY